MTHDEIISGLHPIFAKKLHIWIEMIKSRGIDLALTEGRRTQERQHYLWTLGRSRAGQIVTYARGYPAQSLHCFGLAIDFIPIVKGKQIYDYKIMKECGKIAQSMGLEWGGAWLHFKDYPHIQYTQGKPLSHFQAGGSLDPEEEMIVLSKESRILALTKRLSRTVDASTRDILLRVIERLRNRI